MLTDVSDIYLRQMPSSPTLHRTSNRLSNPERQISQLNSGSFSDGTLPTFKDKLADHDLLPLTPRTLDVLQVNLGYMCNQTCDHCHVDAGPDRKESMTKETMQRILEILSAQSINTLDLTGGAPEMHSSFRWFVEQARPLVDEIIVRSNLTIFSANSRYNDLPTFFAEHNVRVISSLPCYTAENTDRQRGAGVFQRSIQAIGQLNKVGYGQPESGLKLDLVFNPQGVSLPGAQSELERDYKRVLKTDYDLIFNNLLCITNLPISRYLDYLVRNEKFNLYMEKLVAAFNPAAVKGVMCLNSISICWDGTIYDCDFNQMLDLKTSGNSPKHIDQFDMKGIEQRNITLNNHCYGCTAGAGSSCQGSLI